MKPESVDSVILEVSREMGLPEHIVNDMVKVYYKRVLKAMRNSEHFCINVKEFGKFTIQKKKILDRRERIVGQLENTDSSSYKKFRIRNNLLTELDNIDNVLLLIEEEDKKRLNKRKEQYEHDKIKGNTLGYDVDSMQ